jgi:GNAT superfamily N-acetyltransferase
VQLAYFGLLPEFLGRRLGGWFLSESIARAWEWNARRVWVHTCSLDHPAALANYEARGMTVYQIETKSPAGMVISPAETAPGP